MNCYYQIFHSKKSNLKYLLSLITVFHRTTNVTTMAMIKILCDLDRRDKASEMLSKMSESFILSWSKANPHFLLSKESTLTPLGKVSFNNTCNTCVHVIHLIHCIIAMMFLICTYTCKYTLHFAKLNKMYYFF